MKDLRHPSTSSTIEDRGDKSTRRTAETIPSPTRNVDAATIENNPKVNAELLSDFYRLVDASQGVIRGARGANYRLSHPLGSNEVPTDSSEIGKSLSEIKKT
jgi:hypothetical protein